jgi:hypothetical protein
MTKLDDLIDFAKAEPRSLQDMVEQMLLMTDKEWEILSRAIIGLSTARIEADMIRSKHKKGVH